MSQWTDNNSDQWIDNNVDQWYPFPWIDYLVFTTLFTHAVTFSSVATLNLDLTSNLRD